ncbi:MAG: hypothetical protein WAU86_05140 [Oricola sp.]
MTSIEFHNAQRALRNRNTGRLTGLLLRFAARTTSAIATWRKRRRDRAAFLNLLDREEWIYRDMGITRGDVTWASRLPMHMNAAKELEKLRARGMQGR